LVPGGMESDQRPAMPAGPAAALPWRCPTDRAGYFQGGIARPFLTTD